MFIMSIYKLPFMSTINLWDKKHTNHSSLYAVIHPVVNQIIMPVLCPNVFWNIVLLLQTGLCLEHIQNFTNLLAVGC